MTPDTETQKPPAEMWAVVELLGHVKMAGKLSEEERFGSKLGRLDIPNGPGCSGVSAGWCPVCGDCQCKDPEDKNDDGCPLHRAGSKHGENEGERFFTKYFGGGSVYRISIVTEEMARVIAKNCSAAPVSAYEMPRALTHVVPD